MQAKYRFIGIRPFEENEREIFFERGEYIELVLNNLTTNKINVLHSQPGAGKTSLIKAGLLPILKKQINAKVIYISFANFIKEANINPLSQLFGELEDYLPQQSYLDKIIEPENSLWYKLKRIENAQDEPIFLILDQFENVFTHDQTFTYQLRYELYSALYEAIPKNLKKTIENKIQNDPNILSDKGFEKLFSPINLKLLISIRSDKLEKLNFFNEKIKLLDNLLELKPISPYQAKNILLKTASFVPKYNIDNIFASKPFTISENLLNRIINYLSKENQTAVETYQLQIIGRQLEKIAIDNNITIIGNEFIQKVEDIFEDYYESVINAINDKQQQIAAKKFIEDELIFEYEHRKLTVYKGIATLKYGLNNSTINHLINNHIIMPIFQNNDVYYELSNDALINPILIAKEKRIKFEISIQEQLRQKEILEHQNKIQRAKLKVIKIFSVFLSILLVLSIISSIFAIKNSKKSEQLKRLAQSNQFTSYALYFQSKDPTLSLQLTNFAYQIFPKNNFVSQTLVNIFNKNEFCYKNLDSLNIEYTNAKICKNSNYYLLLNSYNNELAIYHRSKKTYIIKKFSKNIANPQYYRENMFLVNAISQNKIYIIDSLGNTIDSINHDRPILYYNYNPINRKIIAYDINENIIIWDVEKKNFLQIIKYKKPIFIDFSGDNEKIISTFSDNTVKIWDNNGKLLLNYEYIPEIPNQWIDLSYCQINPTNNYLAIAINSYSSKSYLVKIIDLKTNSTVANFTDFDDWIKKIQFITEEAFIASTKNGKMYLIDIEKNEIKKIIGHSEEVLDFYWDNDQIISISLDKTVKKWTKISKNQISELAKNADIVKFSNKNNFIATIQKNNVKIYDINGKIKHSFESQFIPKNIEFSADDSYILLYDTIYVSWHNISTKAKTLIKSYEKIIYAATSSDNNQIVVVTKNTIVYYNFKGQKERILVLRKDATNVKMIYNTFLAANSKNVIIYSNYGQIIDSINISNVKDILYTKGDNYNIILATNSQIFVLNKNLKIEFILKPEINFNLIQTSQNGKFIAVANTKKCLIYTQSGYKIYEFTTSLTIKEIEFSTFNDILTIITEDKKGQKFFNTIYLSSEDIKKFIEIKQKTNEIEHFDLGKFNNFVY